MRLTPRFALYAMACTAGWVAVLGCGPAVSLDDPAGGSTGISTGVGPFGEVGSPSDDTMTSPDDGPRQDVGHPRLDVGADTPLPPGACAPDCWVELTPLWVYDGPPGVGGPLDPQDQVVVIVEPTGAVVVAEERQGALELARLSRSGHELWTLPLSLPCDPCRLVELGLHPSGDLLLAGHGVDATGTPIALAARVELGEPSLRWATGTPLLVGTGVAPRAGGLVADGNDLVRQPVLEAAAADAFERLALFAYDADGGDLVDVQPLAETFGTGDAPPPRAAFDALGHLVVTQPMLALFGDFAGTVRWFDLDAAVELASGYRIEPSLRLATGVDGRVVTLGQHPEALVSLLYVDSGWWGAPEQWDLVHVLPTVTSRTPALAMDEHGHAYALARVADGRPGHERAVALEVLRWSENGLLIWKETLPLALDRVDEPISLALTSEGMLVLGGFVAGVRHVELRLPGCDC
jgi:hypothetical protein